MNNSSIISMPVTDTKEIIINCTFELLLTHGYDRVSISDIQKSAGVSRGLLYHYFSSKEDLFVAVTQKYLVSLFLLDPSVLHTFSTQDMINYIIERYRNICNATWGKMPGVSIVNYDFLFYRVIQENADFANVYRHIRTTELAGWMDALKRSIERNEIRRDIDIELTGRQFIFLKDGVWMNAVTKGGYTDLIEDLTIIFNSYYSLLKNHN
ncbi:MAG: TetR/AcrR family transcriptional regulator [Mucinivorans sp.]